MRISELTNDEANGSLGGLGDLGQTKSGMVFGNSNDVAQLTIGVKSKAQVGQLHQLLTRLGYPISDPVGVYGNSTVLAVKAIQEKLSRPETGTYDEALDEQVINASPGLLSPTKKETQLVQQPVLAYPQQRPAEAIINAEGYGNRVTTPGGFMANLMAAVKAQPALFAAGAALFIVGFIIIVPKLRARMSSGGSPALAPVQVMGLGAGPKKKRKSRKSKKA
jgi:peptidoglycan hydrolase-like protein with peptidoglycan-binding domain